MRSLFKLVLAGALPLAVLACKGETKKTGEGGTAQGEILPGSASDAMLPLDTVRSQPPLAPPTEFVGNGAKGMPGDAEDSEAATEAAPAAAPSISVETVE